MKINGFWFGIGVLWCILFTENLINGEGLFGHLRYMISGIFVVASFYQAFKGEEKLTHSEAQSIRMKEAYRKKREEK